MKKLIAAMCSVLLVACSGLSDEERNLYSSECENFVEEHAPGSLGSRGFDMKTFDIFEKKGKWVVEVGFKRRVDYGDTYSVRLCVVDPENGRLFLPSMMGQSEWRK
ncbi:hypothetical protein [Marinobacter lipolyticus]|uniref:hypothetical protein n=1 Tax=Marinobacter lipolyticus TaxID=209639 RepID=UPI003A948D4D